MTFQDPHQRSPFPPSPGPGMAAAPASAPGSAPGGRGSGGTAWALALVTPLVIVLGGYGLLHALFGVENDGDAASATAPVTAPVPAPATAAPAAPAAPPAPSSSDSPVRPSPTAAAPVPEPAPAAPVPDSPAPVIPDPPAQDFSFTVPGTVPRYQLAAIGPFDSSRECAEAALSDLEKGRTLVGTSIADVCYPVDGPTNHHSGAGFYYDRTSITVTTPASPPSR